MMRHAEVPEALGAEVDDIVFDLYGLTDAERALVQGAGKWAAMGLWKIDRRGVQ